MKIHKDSVFSVLQAGERKAKDLSVGDRVLCVKGGEYTLNTITEVTSEPYSEWSKVLDSVFDRTLSLSELYSLETDEMVQVEPKDYNKTSNAYLVSLEEEYDSIVIDGFLITPDSHQRRDEC